MDWIRRNWPDLLIGIALVAVIAGIIATLLTGGSFFPLGQSNGPGDRQSNIGPIAGAVEAGSANSASPADNSTSAAGRNVPGDTPPTVAERSSGSQRPVEVTALPLPGSTTNASSTTRDAAGDNSSQTAAGETSTSGSGSSDAASASSAGAQEAAAANDRPSSSPLSSVDAEGTYRVSVGAFSGSENAERQAATFREAGYPVFIGTQGGLSIVLVGPYDDLADAELVAERIRAGDFDIEPVIYRFRPDETAQQPSPGAAGEAESAGQRSASQSITTGDAPTVQPTASQASGARFLQVGAYASAESAEPQRERLEGLGFRVTERTEGNLVKLLVGPFAGDDLVAARSRLTEQGIEHFPR